MFKNKSLAFSITVVLMTLIVVIYGGISVFNYFSAEEITKNLIRENATNKINLIADTVKSELERIDNTTKFLAMMVGEFDLDSSEIKKLLVKVVKSRDIIFGSTVCLEPYILNWENRYFSPYSFKKNNILQYKDLIDSYNYFEQDWYKHVKETRKPFWTNPYIDKGGGDVLMVTRSMPILRINPVSGEEEFIGVATADIKLSWIKSFLNKIKIYDNGYIFMVSRDGRFISYPDTSNILNKTIHELADINSNITLDSIAIQIENRASGFIKYKSVYNNLDGFLAFVPMDVNGWSIGIFIPKKEALAPVNKLFKELMFYSFVGLIVVFILIIFIVRGIIKPLKLARLTAEKIAQGDIEEGFKQSINSLKYLKLKTKDIETKGLAYINSTDNELYKMIYSFALMTENIKSLLSQVKNSGESLFYVTDKMEEMISNLNKTIEEQVSATAKVADETKSINKTAANLADTTKEVTSNVTAASLLAKHSIKGLDELDNTISSLTDSAENLNSKLDDINRSSKDINQILTTIMKISNQTNILSLNAAIEAEKAGEFGAGFSVVAKEIRRLADQTAESINEIENMISNTLVSVDIGVETVKSYYLEIAAASKKLKLINEDISKTINNISDIEPQAISISSAMESQLAGTEKINSASAKLDDLVKITESAMGETIDLRTMLLESVNNLKNEISKFSVKD